MADVFIASTNYYISTQTSDRKPVKDKQYCGPVTFKQSAIMVLQRLNFCLPVDWFSFCHC